MHLKCIDINNRFVGCYLRRDCLKYNHTVDSIQQQFNPVLYLVRENIIKNNREYHQCDTRVVTNPIECRRRVGFSINNTKDEQYLMGLDPDEHHAYAFIIFRLHECHLSFPSLFMVGRLPHRFRTSILCCTARACSKVNIGYIQQRHNMCSTSTQQPSISKSASAC